MYVHKPFHRIQGQSRFPKIYVKKVLNYSSKRLGRAQLINEGFFDLYDNMISSIEPNIVHHVSRLFVDNI